MAFISNDMPPAGGLFAAYRWESEKSLTILTTILDGLDAIIMVTVPETGEILFINDRKKELFGVGDNAQGRLCYEALHNRKERCDFCPCRQLEEDPGKIVQWDARHPVTGRTHHMTSLLIDWPGGHEAYLEYGVDITKTLRQREVLESVLNSMDSYITVTDLDTDKILFLNRKMVTDFDLRQDIKGDLCWKHCQPGMKKRCDFCPKHRLLTDPGSAVHSKEHNAIVNKTLRVIDRTIDWPGGKLAHMRQAIDITEAEHTQNTLAQREKILDILNQAAMLFLKRSQGEFDDAMGKGIGLIAGLANVDRMSVHRNAERPDGLHFSQLYRWSKARGGTLPVRARLRDATYAALIPRWEKILAAGGCVGGMARLMPEARVLQQFGCIALLAVPVFTDDRFWGMVIYEKLVEENFTAFEIDVLRSASFMLANAVMRNEEAIEIERSDKLLRGITSVSAIMLQTDPRGFEADLLRSLGILAKATDTDRVYIWKNHERDGRFYCSLIYEWSENVEPRQGKDYAVESAYDDMPRWEAAFLEKRCINSIVRDLPVDEQVLLCPQGVLSILLMPIFIRNVFWGVIAFDDCRQERRFSEDEENILRSASDMIANSLIRNEEAVALREADTRAYAMLHAQAHWYKSILDATPLPVSVTDANGNWSFVNKAVENFLGRRNNDLLGKPCSEWNSHICNSDACGIACVKRGIRQTFFEQNGLSYQVDIGILRTLEGESTGFVEIVQDITEVRNMTRRQLEMEASIFHLQSEVAKNSYDPLTGSYSRRFFEETLDRLMHTLSRSHGALSLMMVDVDYFKQYNDTYGHLKGDDCLKTVAESLRACLLRKDDFVARYGGEEFVVILPNTDEDGARMIADKMLQDIRRHAVPHAKSAVADCVTASIGVVSGQVRHTHNVSDFLKRADELLYASKQGGRNRYTFARL